MEEREAEEKGFSAEVAGRGVVSKSSARVTG